MYIYSFAKLNKKF